MISIKKDTLDIPLNALKMIKLHKKRGRFSWKGIKFNWDDG